MTGELKDQLEQRNDKQEAVRYKNRKREEDVLGPAGYSYRAGFCSRYNAKLA